MITKTFSIGKMLRNFLIFSLLFVAINADAKFAVLQAPNSLSFQGNEPIPAEDIGEIFAASTGNSVSGSSHWHGLTIDDPFDLPRNMILAVVEGSTVDITPVTFESTIEGGGIGVSLSNFIADAKADKISTCDIDYSVSKATSQKCFGNAVSRDVVPTLPTTTSLSKDDAVAQNFLSAIADVNAAIDNYLKLKNNKDVELKSVIVLRLSLDSIVKAYGADSAQVTEAVSLLKNTFSKLQKASGDNIFVVISGTTALKSRSKREIITGSATANPYNLADNYDEDYPVIFNIILWFMVAFALSLLAISYAIGSMDPGRDSIIYRMTSTRMKKDN